MNRKLIFLIIVFKSSFCFSQNNNSCSCDGLINIDYKNTILIYDKPLGKVLHSVKQDFANEDFLVFRIDKDSAGYFHLKVSYSLKQESFTGWIKKANYLGTYSRSYIDTLKLFNKPDSTSTIKNVVPEWKNDFLLIVACSDKWVYIKNRKVTEGWMRESDQCANPYTTCN